MLPNIKSATPEATTVILLAQAAHETRGRLLACLKYS
jgi:hypothetical protein